MADTSGGLDLPRRVSLGNLLSMVVTVVMAAAVAGGVWVLLGHRVTEIEQKVAEFPSTYARQADLDRVARTTDQLAADQKITASDLQKAIADVLQKIGDTNVVIAGQSGVLTSMKDSIAEIKEALRERPSPRRSQPP